MALYVHWAQLGMPGLPGTATFYEHYCHFLQIPSNTQYTAAQFSMRKGFTGKKETDKVYTRYTGYPGGQRFNTPAELRTKKDGVDKMLRHAVKGMLPKGPLGRSILKNLYIFEGTEHNMQAQKPKALDINQFK